EEYGAQSILYYEQYGSGSLLKSIGDIFFNFFGGCSKQKGGPCWSAGIAAQKQNFGDVRSHCLEDMINSRTIIVWGKNPANTTIHTMQMIKKAKQNGSYIIVIDPIKTETAKLADYYVQVNPGGDGALALAIGKKIIEENRFDAEYVAEHVNGFQAYKNYVENLDMNTLCKRAGVNEDVINFITEKYTELYSTILLGYGLQKYSHGGNTISLIDTLAAITGQIGKSGGGVNYANKVYTSILNTDPYHSENYADNRIFYVSKMSSFIKENNIKMAIITKSNLLNQLPDLNSLEESLKSIDFKVCIDQFLTDTVQICDLFIPATTVLESEDLIFSSMTNPYITYIEKAVEPKNSLMDEYYFFMKLAEELNIQHYPRVSKKEYLTNVIEPLKEIVPQISLEYIRDNYITIHESIPWMDKNFMTQSGKFEIFFNEEILKEMLEKGNDKNHKNCFRILTTHGRESLFSQHYMDKDEKAEAYINMKMAEKCGFKSGDCVYIESQKGRIKVKLIVDDGISDNVVMMYAGWWKKQGNPNWIMESGISDIGGQVTYNDNFVKLYKQE
ncbi:MAG: molybdopterin-dependent oxidoreductase, partial [Clostridium butyricum]|nr:molybdopterin-dependent oxidoreductase [Clostridium butyricum]